jgi:hypothetical protein
VQKVWPQWLKLILRRQAAEIIVPTSWFAPALYLQAQDGLSPCETHPANTTVIP